MALRPLARHNPQLFVEDGYGDSTEDGRNTETADWVGEQHMFHID